MRSGSFPTPCLPQGPASSLRRGLLFFFLSSLLLASPKQHFDDFTTPLPLHRGDTLVIGIAGGWEKWSADHNLTRRLTNHLRAKHLPGVHVETVENHRLHLARQLLLRAFDFDGDGKLEAHEKRDARVVIYGHSLGGAATVRLSRWLHKLQVPVRFTLQIDSVGLGDTKIPPNVHAAANLYQNDFALIRGESRIHAADPSRTKILGNFRYHYPFARFVPMVGAPLFYNLLQTPHLKMEYDPEVWLAAEGLLLTNLPH